jgi:hypothetical protein
MHLDFTSPARKWIFISCVVIWFLGTVYYLNAIQAEASRSFFPLFCGSIVIFFVTFPLFSAQQLKQQLIIFVCLYIGYGVVVYSFNLFLSSRRCENFNVIGILDHCDYHNRDLSGLDLHDANLAFSNFSGGNLSGANLSNANLSNTDFSSATLSQVVLTGANLDYALFVNTIGLTNEMLASIASGRGVLFQTRETLLEQAGVVCQGVPVAREINQDHNFHPLLAFDTEGKPNSITNVIPPDWLPSSIDSLELVVCVSPPQEQQIEVCNYSPSFGSPNFDLGSAGTVQWTIERMEYVVNITMIDAASGESLREVSVQGDDPRSCPAHMELRESQYGGQETYHGDQVTNDEILEMLATYVHPTAQRPPLTLPDGAG